MSKQKKEKVIGIIAIAAGALLIGANTYQTLTDLECLLEGVRFRNIEKDLSAINFDIGMRFINTRDVPISIDKLLFKVFANGKPIGYTVSIGNNSDKFTIPAQQAVFRVFRTRIVLAELLYSGVLLELPEKELTIKLKTNLNGKIPLEIEADFAVNTYIKKAFGYISSVFGKKTISNSANNPAKGNANNNGFGALGESAANLLRELLSSEKPVDKPISDDNPYYDPDAYIDTSNIAGIKGIGVYQQAKGYELDIINSWVEWRNKYGYQGREILSKKGITVNYIPEKNIPELLKRLFIIVKKDLKYKEETDQYILSPLQCIEYKNTVDCKSFVMYGSSLLSALGINHFVRFAAYDTYPNGYPKFSHVYILVPHMGTYLYFDTTTIAYGFKEPDAINYLDYLF